MAKNPILMTALKCSGHFGSSVSRTRPLLVRFDHVRDEFKCLPCPLYCEQGRRCLPCGDTKAEWSERSEATGVNLRLHDRQSLYPPGLFGPRTKKKHSFSNRTASSTRFFTIAARSVTGLRLESADAASVEQGAFYLKLTDGTISN